MTVAPNINKHALPCLKLLLKVMFYNIALVPKNELLMSLCKEMCSITCSQMG